MNPGLTDSKILSTSTRYPLGARPAAGASLPDCSGLEEAEALSPVLLATLRRTPCGVSPSQILSQVLGRASAPPTFWPTRWAAENLPGRLGPKDRNFLAIVFSAAVCIPWSGAQARKYPKRHKQTLSTSRVPPPQEKGVSLTNLDPEHILVFPLAPGDPLFTQWLEWLFQRIDQIMPLTH